MLENDYPVIDISGTSRTLGLSVDFYLKVLKRFLAARDEYLLPITQFALEKNYTALSIIAHRLKGAAAYLNIEELKSMAFEIEIMAQKKITADYQVLIYRIYEIFNKISTMDELS